MQQHQRHTRVVIPGTWYGVISSEASDIEPTTHGSSSSSESIHWSPIWKTRSTSSGIFLRTIPGFASSTCLSTVSCPQAQRCIHRQYKLER